MTEQITTFEVPTDLREEYDEVASQVNKFTRQYWQLNANGTPADAAEYVHEKRLAAAAQLKVDKPKIEEYHRQIEKRIEATKCRACRQATRAQGSALCAPCTRVADFLAASADLDRIATVTSYLNQVDTWSGHDIASLTTDTDSKP